MDRLISENKVLEAIDNLKANFTCYDSVTLDEVYSHVKAIPSAEPKCESCELNRQRFMQTLDVAFELGKASAEPYKGMTNGEIMHKLFPNDCFVVGEYGFDEKWWNSPYEPQERSEE